jgi:hypothetical protein
MCTRWPERLPSADRQLTPHDGSWSIDDPEIGRTSLLLPTWEDWQVSSTFEAYVFQQFNGLVFEAGPSASRGGALGTLSGNESAELAYFLADAR